MAAKPIEIILSIWVLAQVTLCVSINQQKILNRLVDFFHPVNYMIQVSTHIANNTKRKF